MRGYGRADGKDERWNSERGEKKKLCAAHRCATRFIHRREKERERVVVRRCVTRRAVSSVILADDIVSKNKVSLYLDLAVAGGVNNLHAEILAKYTLVADFPARNPVPINSL